MQTKPEPRADERPTARDEAFELLAREVARLREAARQTQADLIGALEALKANNEA